MSSNEQPPVRSLAQAQSFQGVTAKNDGQPEMTPPRRLLLSLARKLHDNEASLAFIRIAFRMFQRIGITVSPNHYYWPVPDFRELESRNWPTEAETRGLDLAFDRQLVFLQTVVPQYQGRMAIELGAVFQRELQLQQWLLRDRRCGDRLLYGSPLQAATYRGSGRRLQQPCHGSGPRSKLQAGWSARRAGHN